MFKNDVCVSKVFYWANAPWCDNYDINVEHISSILKAYYGLLKTRGYLFLNEIYQGLGFPLTKQGAMFGWIYRDEDNYDIMFHIMKEREGSANVRIVFKNLEDVLRILPYE